MHRLLLPSWEPDAERTFTLRWSLWASRAKIVEGQIWSGWNQAAPAHLFLHGLPQDLCSVFYQELLLFSWVHSVLILSCQLIYRQQSPSTECILWGGRSSPSPVCGAYPSSAATIIVLLKGKCSGLLSGTWASRVWAAPTQTWPFSHNQSGCMQTVPCAGSSTPQSGLGVQLDCHKEAQMKKRRSCTKWRWEFLAAVTRWSSFTLSIRQGEEI